MLSWVNDAGSLSLFVPHWAGKCYILRFIWLTYLEEFAKQNDREIWNYYNEASVYTRQGLEYRIFLNDFNIEQFYEFSIVLHALKDNAFHFLRFEDDTVGSLNIFNINHLALIKIPAAAYNNADADE